MDLIYLHLVSKRQMWTACSFMLRTAVKEGLIPSWGFGIPGWSEARAWTNACLLQWPLTSIGASQPTHSAALALDTLWTHACTLFAVGREDSSHWCEGKKGGAVWSLIAGCVHELVQQQRGGVHEGRARLVTHADHPCCLHPSPLHPALLFQSL